MANRQARTTKWLLPLGIVVLAAILGSALFPFPKRPKLDAHAKACLSNVKQLTTSMLLYAADNDGVFPISKNWMDATTEHRDRNDDLLRCNSTPVNVKYAYAMNQVLSSSRKPPNPDNVPLIFESDLSVRNAFGTLDSLPDPPRHKGKIMIGYADGHAKAVDPNQP